MGSTSRRNLWNTRIEPGKMRSSPVGLIVEDGEETTQQDERIQHLKASIEALREDMQVDEAIFAKRHSDMPTFRTKLERKREQQRTQQAERRADEKQTAIAQLTNLVERLEQKVTDARRRRERTETIRQYEEDIVRLTRDAERTAAEMAQCQKEVELLRQEQREEEGSVDGDEGEGFAVVDTGDEPYPHHNGEDE
ncbi:hypothetical protein LTS10_013149 [Elasticomyces elasticus]|nr:hypothetical protein LTS10_013149 [Elasticomyces elasticus]